MHWLLARGEHEHARRLRREVQLLQDNAEQVVAVTIQRALLAEQRQLLAQRQQMRVCCHNIVASRPYDARQSRWRDLAASTQGQGSLGNSTSAERSVACTSDANMTGQGSEEAHYRALLLSQDLPWGKSEGDV